MMSRRKPRMMQRGTTPNQISGLTLWLEYDYGVYTDTALTTPAVVTNTVKGWQDRSGNGYHATEATNPPTLAADGLTFDGTNDVLRVARMTGAFSAGFSYFVVASLPDGQPAAAKTIFAGQNSSPVDSLFFLRVISSGGLEPRVFENNVGVSLTLATLPDNQTSVFLAAATANPSGNLVGYFNGTQAGTPAALTGLTWANLAQADTETIAIGALMSNAATVGSFGASIFKALLVYNRPLTAAELITAHRYLGSKYAITVP